MARITSKTTVPALTDLQVTLLDKLRGSTTVMPLTTENLAVLTTEEIDTILPELDALEDVHGKVIGERRSGTVVWWMEESTPKAAPVKRTPAKKAAAPKPTEKPSEAPEKAVVPPLDPRFIAAAKGHNGTPVESQTGLTRAQVAAELPSVVLEVQPENWSAPEFEPTVPEYEAPISVPAPPEGVSENWWDLAHNANTAPARKFWAEKVQEQLKAYDAAQTAKRTAEGDAPPF